MLKDIAARNRINSLLNILLLTSPFEHHLHTPSWPQRYERLKFDRMVRHHPQPISLGDGGEDQLRFGEREQVADAHARAAAEWKVCVARTAGGALDREALGLEAIRIFPERR